MFFDRFRTFCMSWWLLTDRVQRFGHSCAVDHSYLVAFCSLIMDGTERFWDWVFESEGERSGTLGLNTPPALPGVRIKLSWFKFFVVGNHTFPLPAGRRWYQHHICLDFLVFDINLSLSEIWYHSSNVISDQWYHYYELFFRRKKFLFIHDLKWFELPAIIFNGLL